MWAASNSAMCKGLAVEPHLIDIQQTNDQASLFFQQASQMHLQLLPAYDIGRNQKEKIVLFHFGLCSATSFAVPCYSRIHV